MEPVAGLDARVTDQGNRNCSASDRKHGARRDRGIGMTRTRVLRAPVLALGALLALGQALPARAA